MLKSNLIIRTENTVITNYYCKLLDNLKCLSLTATSLPAAMVCIADSSSSAINERLIAQQQEYGNKTYRKEQREKMEADSKSRGFRSS